MPRLEPVLIFLEASHAALVRRFSETRRPHPLAPDRSVSEGIRDERPRARPIRELADEIIDTSDLTVHELRAALHVGSSQRPGRAPGPGGHAPQLRLQAGVPLDADMVFDVRFLPNPHFVPALRPQTGRDRAVVRFLRSEPPTREFLRTADRPAHVPGAASTSREGKSYLTVAIGCTGGRHRSVMVAEALAHAAEPLKGVQVRVRHRDMGQPHDRQRSPPPEAAVRSS